MTRYLPYSHALLAYDFDPREFGSVAVPVTFLCGSESPAIQRVTTNALAASLPSASVVDLPGQGHDSMFSDPELFVSTVIRAFGA